MAKIKAFAVVNDSVMGNLPGSIQVQDGGRLIGGYSWVGKIGAWNAILLTTTPGRLTTVENAAGNNAVVLVRMTADERGELDIDIDGAALAKVSTFLANRGYPVEENAPARQILRRLYKRFLPDFEPEQVEIN